MNSSHRCRECSAKQLNFCSTLTCIHQFSQWKIVSEVCVHRVHSFMYIHSVWEAPYRAFKPPEQELLHPLNYSKRVLSVHIDADVSVTREPSDKGIALKVTDKCKTRCRPLNPGISNTRSKYHDIKLSHSEPFEISPTPTDGLRPTCTAPDL